ncbi:MAG: GHKL domain-containing protein [Clostridiales bacterium]|nr:GHKL domain-containing protein [Clostridiales bacterium]
MDRVTIIQTLVMVLIVLIILMIAYLFFRQKMAVYAKQEKELQMYQLYVKPLEDCIRDIRARQHEFDNHLNAILNMHLTIGDYEELVAAQSEYMRSLVTQRDHSYLGLLKISNKVLAGFLYSKLTSIPEKISVELIVGSKEIFTNVPEMELVEVLGTLIDNAVQACDDENHEIKIYLTSKDDRFIFIIKNQHEKVAITTLGQFFERGFTTKDNETNHGLGLYNAKKIIKRWNGEIFVENESIGNKNYLSFHVVL